MLQLDEQAHRKRRIVAVIASTFISLACGTNYAYSAWAPQFADHMKLSATQSNLIGSMGNIGMYASGIPLGYIVDTRGPRPGVFIGTLALGGGYYPIKKAYDGGEGSMSMVILCLLSFLTGMGSCAAFQASIKTSALNWPHHRGTATAFPLAAFGLSAFFFTGVSGLIFGDDTSDYLLLLAIGTSALTAASFFFVTVPQADSYLAVSTDEPLRRDSNPLERTSSRQSKLSRSRSPVDGVVVKANDSVGELEIHEAESSSENVSLLSGSSGPGDIVDDDLKPGTSHHHHHSHSHRPDISGIQLLRKVEFYSLWVMLGILTGIGLMTINNIGNNVQALWYSDPDADSKFIQGRQLMHVSLLSIMSFCGRLLSGVGSDVLIKRLHMSRFWCLVCSSCVFTCAQIAALNVADPHFLWIVSSLTGLAYGALFGVYPALVADTFGVSGLSVNWGFMTLAPVLCGNIFSLAYGGIFDAHSKVLPSGMRVCEDGIDCYKGAYWFTFFSSLVGICCALWCVWHEGYVRRKEQAALDNDHRA